MKTKEFESLSLNMHDILDIELKNFYYKITKTPGKITVRYGYNKANKKGWIHCTEITGEYLGELYKQNGELYRIKIRVSHPFKMHKADYNYLLLDPSAIVAMVPKTIFDELCHEVTPAKEKVLELA